MYVCMYMCVYMCVYMCMCRCVYVTRYVSFNSELKSSSEPELYFKSSTVL